MKDLFRTGGKISEISIRDEMKQSFIDYAMSVIVSRALPDVRGHLRQDIASVARAAQSVHQSLAHGGCSVVCWPAGAGRVPGAIAAVVWHGSAQLSALARHRQREQHRALAHGAEQIRAGKERSEGVI